MGRKGVGVTIPNVYIIILKIMYIIILKRITKAVIINMENR